MFRRLVDDDYIYRMLCIDNGSNFLGTVVLDLDLRTGLYYLIHAETFEGAQLIREEKPYVHTHGARWVRENALRDKFREALFYWCPDAVPVENNFFQPGRVQTFETLAEMKVFLRQAVEEYDDSMDLTLISPGEAKRAVQPTSFTMKKVVIKDCILALKNLIICENNIHLENLTEHEYDGVAVGMCLGERIRRATGFVR